MRNKLCAIVVVAMVMPAMAANGQSELEYRDDFGNVTFSGSDGNLDWSGSPWIETGESDGPDAGQVHIGDEDCANNKCLHIEGKSLLALGRTATRAADLSSFATAKLSYEVHLAPSLVSTGVLHVEVRGKGSVWSPIKTYALALSEGRHANSVNVLAFAGSDFQVRFRLTGLLGGDAVAIDRVVLEGEPVAPPTTSSTSTSTTSASTPTTSSSSSTSSTSSTSTTTAGTSTPTSQNGSGKESPRTIATTAQGDAGPRDTATTTTRETDSTASLPVAAGGPNPPQPPDLEMHQSGRLLMADYNPGMYGRDGVEVLAVSLDADYSLAVEVFGQIKLWLALLALLVAGVAVSGIEQKRRLTLRSPSSRREGPVAG